MAGETTGFADTVVVRVRFGVRVIRDASIVESTQFHDHAHQSNAAVGTVSAEMTGLLLTPRLLATDLMSGIWYQVNPFFEGVHASHHAEEFSH